MKSIYVVESNMRVREHVRNLGLRYSQEVSSGKTEEATVKLCRLVSTGGFCVFTFLVYNRSIAALPKGPQAVALA
jgi:hypothetical protein